MKQNSLIISKYTEKSKELIIKIKDFFKQIGYNANLSNNVFDKPISIVFAGQYSAGKSTILKLLTDRKDIAIGDGITTQQAHTYDWKGFEIIDTPGIHTELRPDHDEISYRAIANADMLVYVVTCQLFDSFIGSKFRVLLNEKSKGNEMILVVNKMAEEGNTPDIQKAKLDSLQEVTKPYTPEQLRTVFIDAKSYIKSKSLENSKHKEILYQRSNYETFIATLNSFIKEKQIPAHLTTPLYQIIDVLDDAILKNQNKLEDEDINRLEEKYRQERYALSSSKWNIKNKINGIISECVSNIQNIGRKTAEKLDACKKKEEAENLIETAYKKVDEEYIAYVNEIVKDINDEIKICSQNLDDLYNKEWVKNLDINITERYKQGDSKIINLLSPNNLKNASQYILESTKGTNLATGGLKAFSGSNAQQFVKNIGHYLGHSFKPWESLKWVNKLKVAGKFLGIFAVVLEIGLQIKKDKDNEKIEQQKKENRNEIRARFNDVAKSIEKEFKKVLEKFISEYYDKPINEKDNQIEEIGKLRENKTDICIKLEGFKSNCKKLIEDIHKEFKMNEIVLE